MIAFVLPYTKTPRGVDGFDYRIPEELIATVQPGSMVMIPFRRTLVLGLVWKIENTPEKKYPYSLKYIDSLLPLEYWSTPQRLQLLDWFHQTYAVSLPTAFKTLQFQLPAVSRIATYTAQIQEAVQSQKTAAGTGSLPTMQEAADSDPTGHSLVIFRSRHEQYTEYQKRIAAHSGPVLIVTPEEYRIQEILDAITSTRDILVYTNTTTSRQRFRIQQQLRMSASVPPLLIGSKKSLFFDLPKNTLVIIDDEHEKAHKQYDSNPRFRTFDIAHALLNQGLIHTLYSMSYAPSQRTWNMVHASTSTYPQRLVNLGQKWNPDRIHIVDMNNERSNALSGWLAESTLTQIEHASGPTLLFLNRLGNNTLSACRDCGETVEGSGAVCRYCGSTLVTVHRKGVVQLAEELHTLFPQRTVHLLNSSTEALQKGVMGPSDIIIATEAILHTPLIHAFQSIIVLSVDFMLVFPHFASRERVFQILTQLAIEGTPLFIQTYAPQLPIFRYVQHNQVVDFCTDELSVRRLLHLPPDTPQWIARHPTTKTTTPLAKREDIFTLPADAMLDSID